MRIRGGIGALGSAQARFFHPSANIREKWPNEYQKKRLTGVVITGKGTHRVNRKDQLCYECSIPEIDGTTFHVVVNNFRVERAAATSFEDEQATTAPSRESASQTLQELALRLSTEDEVRNFNRSDEIAELRQQGIEVDDDNEPAPENAEPPPQATGDVGEWVTPTICPRRQANCTNRKGSWKNYSWQVIAEMDELAQFRMCFPEEWASEVLIPTTNENLEGQGIDLQEFYVFLGCHFFMASFEGISDRKLWWSSKPVDMFEGAPFRLNNFISKKRFLAISVAIRYTDKPPPEDFVDLNLCNHDLRDKRCQISRDKSHHAFIRFSVVTSPSRHLFNTDLLHFHHDGRCMR